MATKVILPKQGLQMTEGTIVKWLVKEGDKVDEEQPLFEMETDKVTMAVEAPASGVLLKVVRNEGETVKVAETVAIIGDESEDISEFLKEAPSVEKKEQPGPEKGTEKETHRDAAKEGQELPAAAEGSIPEEKTEFSARVFSTPRARMIAENEGIDISQVKGTGPEGLIIEEDVRLYAATRPKATPLAKKLAEQHDVKLDHVEGTGARGKITKADIEKAVQDRMKYGKAERGERVIPLTGMRKIIAERMMASIHGMAQASLRMNADMTEAIRIREKYKNAGVKVSFTDIIIKIVSKALLEYPMVNSSFDEQGITVKEYVNIGVAVALSEGLIVPVIKNADLMSLQEISLVSAEIIEKARTGSLLPDEYQGGTFTVTNLGMYDVDEFVAVINPPESAILAVGKINRVPVAEKDELIIKPIMNISLTYDHRVMDGAYAAKFLQRVKELIENPYLLI